MQAFSGEALVLTTLPHAESGAVVRFLCFEGGLRAGYVPGARGKGRRALLSPGNRIQLGLRARAEGQLASATIELIESRALIAFDPTAAAILAWVCELTARVLAENQPHPRLAHALDALLGGLQAGMDETSAHAALARYELLLLEAEGFGLDLGSCALGGPAADLAYVSPRTGRAVSAQMAQGQPWQRHLLELPRFLINQGQPTPETNAQALQLTGHFLNRHWLQGSHQSEKLLALRLRACLRASQRLASSARPPKAME